MRIRNMTGCVQHRDNALSPPVTHSQERARDLLHSESHMETTAHPGSQYVNNVELIGIQWSCIRKGLIAGWGSGAVTWSGPSSVIS